ncbi:hypothetical protein [Endozoicomonas sp. ONNA1]|uniref:hypothetical protein n=2 Tax=unclassified Endozoicomonas TaxID=2644528 RepID=UPI0021480D87|nr:hypothetical protein [Endozoicomonas sp. ONNA1]
MGIIGRTLHMLSRPHGIEKIDNPGHKSFTERLKYDEVPRMQYAYPVYRAAIEAQRLGIKRISVIEFGVFTGHGMQDLESIAEQVEPETGVKIDVIGFDSGKGMPPPVDYRDMPYVWQEGFFSINVDEVKKHLHRSELILGDVGETVHEFMKKDRAPIGFISFDLDYYSSTVRAFELLKYPDKHFLPRTYCYFDDIVGDDYEIHCECVGELLAIKEFNEENEKRVLCPIHKLRNKRIVPAGWTEHIYVFHIFDHPLYSKYINTDKDW